VGRENVPVPSASAPTASPSTAPIRRVLGRVVRRLDGSRRGWLWAGLVAFALSAWTVLASYLLGFPDEIWQVDLEVYREGSRSLVDGRPVYEWLTEAPQYLPFTYPPFAALVGTPLLLVPFPVAGWLWSLLQLALLWVCVGVAFRPLLERAGARRGFAQGAVCAVLIQLQPLQEGIRFGQVNAVIVTLCLLDVVHRQRRMPAGSLSGFAIAVKLTPAVFWIHWVVTRQWRVLAASVVTAASVTAVTALFAPAASVSYWTDALFDPGRLGPNAGTSNQSIRGVLLRLGPPPGTAATVLLVLAVAVAAVLGFRLAARLHALDQRVAVVGTVGLVAVLISPVSWVHHLHWSIVVLGALLGDGRDRRRVWFVAGSALLLFLKLPQTGYGFTQSDIGAVVALGWIVEQTYFWWVLVALGAIWFFLVRPAGQGAATPTAASRVSTASTAHTDAPIRRTADRLILRSSARPSSAATPDTTSSASQDPANTETGSR